MRGRTAWLGLTALLAAGGAAASPAALREADVSVALHAAADSLSARIDAEGRFHYRLSADGSALPGYNVVRHAGALWALQDYHRDHPEPALAEALSRASRWLETCCLRPLPRWPFEAVWSGPEGEPEEAKLGAAGLALAAWNGLAEQGLAHPAPPRLHRLAQFIVYLQKPDGHFHSKYRDGRRRDRWVSLYYPGEAALGLLAQHRREPDPRWRGSAQAALLALARDRLASGQYPADHWALIATAALAKIEAPVPDALLDHVDGVLAPLLDAQLPAGDFGHARRSAPSATRLEALAAALQLGDPETAAWQAQWQAFERGTAFLLRLPQTEGPYPGALPRAAADSTDRRRGELRIDDTQHVLSVWLAWCRLQKASCIRA